MPTPAQEPLSAELPVLDGADLKVVRFGNGAAGLILLFIAALAAVAVTVALRDHVAAGNEPAPLSLRMPITNEQELPAPLPDEGAVFGAEAPAAKQPAASQTRTAAPDRSVAPQERERNRRTDQAFESLDLTSVEAMRAFLTSHGKDRHADESGYLAKVSASLRSALAGNKGSAARQDDAGRMATMQEQEEERKRRQEQQAVPWDMGVEPPASGN